MKNEIMPYKSVDDFARAVYEKITGGIDKLGASEQVDTVLHLDEMFRKAASAVREHLYGHAEQQQTTVLEEHAGAYQATAQNVVRATQGGDLTTVDVALEKSLEATLKCKESATKLRQIKERKSVLKNNGTTYLTASRE